jgi:hypothetical protein
MMAFSVKSADSYPLPHEQLAVFPDRGDPKRLPDPSPKSG